MTRRLPLTLWIASLVVSGCGGGGGGGSGHTAHLPAETGLCGWITATGDYYTSNEEPHAGDLYLPPTALEEGRRGFLSFDISSIPPTATVVSATLRYRLVWDPATPFGLGRLVFDQVVYGDVLDVGAYDRAFPVNQAFADVEGAPPGSVSEVDATAPVQSDLASMHSRSQFRLRFELETNHDQKTTDVYIELFGASPPELVVRWQ